MTVCLGIISSEPVAVAVVADRMVTGGLPEVEFEYEGSKINELARNCMMLTAGDALRGRTLSEAVQQQLAIEEKAEADGWAIADIVEIMKDVLRQQRILKAEEEHLKPRGTTLKEFYERWIKEWPLEVAAGIDSLLASFSYGIQVLVAGVDDEAHLYLVRDPGTAECFDGLGFCAIGAGAPLAMLHCISAIGGPCRGTKQALYVAHEAKVAAEPTPGVGQETNMVLIQRDARYEISQDVLRKLRRAQLEARPKRTTDMETILGQLQLLPDEGEGEV